MAQTRKYYVILKCLVSLEILQHRVKYINIRQLLPLTPTQKPPKPANRGTSSHIRPSAPRGYLELPAYISDILSIPSSSPTNVAVNIYFGAVPDIFDRDQLHPPLYENACPSVYLLEGVLGSSGRGYSMGYLYSTAARPDDSTAVSYSISNHYLYISRTVVCHWVCNANITLQKVPCTPINSTLASGIMSRIQKNLGSQKARFNRFGSIHRMASSCFAGTCFL